MAESDSSKANMFADFFQKQYIQSGNINLTDILNTCGENTLEIDIEEDDICKALESINVNKGAGPDGISPKLLRNCVASLTEPLTTLFRKSFDEGHMPAALKTSRIVPIFKSGKKTIVTNYRAVVIIPTIAKVFEVVMFNKISIFVRERTTQNQHGFVKGRSTSTNLMEMVNYTMDAMVEKCQTDVLYTDFEKAFDRVNHRRLLQKLALFGFGNKLVKWCYGYLTSRKQFVQIGQEKSGTFSVASGVPAGSILGPCFFIVFMNDIVNFSEMFKYYIPSAI